jgi:hypothetical protein
MLRVPSRMENVFEFTSRYRGLAFHWEAVIGRSADVVGEAEVSAHANPHAWARWT